MTAHGGSAAEEAWRQADAHRLLLRVRGLLAMAESSVFAAEAEAFTEKARTLADEYGNESALLRFPREPKREAAIVAELERLQETLEGYEADAGLWATKSAEWAACLE